MESNPESIIEEIAHKIVDRGLETPVIFFLEMNKPVSRLMGQSVLLTVPFLAPFLGLDRVEKYATFFQEIENVERLIQKIEELSQLPKPR
jgi:hypothetical protein